MCGHPRTSKFHPNPHSKHSLVPGVCTPAARSVHGRTHLRKRPAQTLEEIAAIWAGNDNVPRPRRVVWSRHIGSEWTRPLGPTDSLAVGRPKPKGSSMKAKVRASLAKSQGRCPKPHYLLSDPTPPNGNKSCHLPDTLQFTKYLPM